MGCGSISTLRSTAVYPVTDDEEDGSDSFLSTALILATSSKRSKSGGGKHECALRTDESRNPEHPISAGALLPAAFQCKMVGVLLDADAGCGGNSSWPSGGLVTALQKPPEQSEKDTGNFDSSGCMRNEVKDTEGGDDVVGARALTMPCSVVIGKRIKMCDVSGISQTVLKEEVRGSEQLQSMCKCKPLEVANHSNYKNTSKTDCLVRVEESPAHAQNSSHCEIVSVSSDTRDLQRHHGSKESPQGSSHQRVSPVSLQHCDQLNTRKPSAALVHGQAQSTICYSLSKNYNIQKLQLKLGFIVGITA